MSAPSIITRLLILPAVIAFFSLSAANSVAAKKPVVTSIKHWSNPSYTRVVINLSDKTGFSHRLLNQDPSIKMEWRRLYIDLKDAVPARSLEKDIPIDDGLLKKARVGQYDKETVRVVLDIESIEDYKIFPLSDPFRIVIDVTGAKAKDSKSSAAPSVPLPVVPPVAASNSPSLSQQLGLKINTIVLDPGHGGKDPGAIGKKGLKEKDVTLKIGKLLREKLAGKAANKVLMTRETDVYIPLEERTAIANSHDADLFVSIHVNASPRRAASGVETYILNISADEESKRVAARENATSRRSVGDLEFILNDLIKTAKTNDSARLAESVHEKLVVNLKANYRDIKSNGVKGAPFYVLVGTKMPSILVEVSFISNPDEEKRLTDERYIKEIVEGIAAGLMHYIESINNTGASV